MVNASGSGTSPLVLTCLLDFVLVWTHWIQPTQAINKGALNQPRPMQVGFLRQRSWVIVVHNHFHLSIKEFSKVNHVCAANGCLSLQLFISWVYYSFTFMNWEGLLWLCESEKDREREKQFKAFFFFLWSWSQRERANNYCLKISSGLLIHTWRWNRDLTMFSFWKIK